MKASLWFISNLLMVLSTFSTVYYFKLLQKWMKWQTSNISSKLLQKVPVKLPLQIVTLWVESLQLWPSGVGSIISTKYPSLMTDSKFTFGGRWTPIVAWFNAIKRKVSS